MKHTFLTIGLLLSALIGLAQSDSIYLHNGTKFACGIVRVTESGVVYHFENETAEQSYGKYAVWKVVFGKSGRVQKITGRIHVDRDGEWENVVFIENPEEIVGLTKKDDIEFKTGVFVINTAQGVENKSVKKLKQQAAALGCPFIVLTNEKRGSSFGAAFNNNRRSQKGVAYSY